MRIVLFGDGRWAADTLQRLSSDGHDVAAVVVRARASDSLLENAATAMRIPVQRPAGVNAPAFVTSLAALAPDLGVSVSYDQILRRAVLDVPRYGMMNLHAGKLPQYRGRNVINWAIINGEEEIGLTAHVVDEGIDTGPILKQITLPISWADGYGDVLAHVVAALPGLAADTVREIAAGTATPVPQRAQDGTYFAGRGNGDEWLDWSASSRSLYNKVRAISRPGPGALTLLDGHKIVVWRARYDPSWPCYIATPGQVVGRVVGDEGGALVKTGDSTLLVQEVQITGAPSTPPRWRIGTRLGNDLGTALLTALDRVATLERRLLKEELA
jgi:methionyl-tRNA formyltransferase